MTYITIPEGFSVEERVARAEEIFQSGYNCCQAVALAFSDLLPLDEDQIKAATSGFGGGFGRLREVCGAVSGMTFVAGFVRPATDPSQMGQRKANYALVQEWIGRFREERGSIICRELLGLRAGEKESPQPSERTQGYYHARPCVASVGIAARIVAEGILAETAVEPSKA